MPMRVGFHLEGWDHLIVRTFLARLLYLPEEELRVEQVEIGSRGWQSIVQVMPQALKRFYYSCIQFAVVGIDNDGNCDLVKTGASEDPRRPRHWNHAEQHADCRYCRVMELVERTRPQLSGLSQKPAATWPVLVVVPVESIETWLLTLRAIVAGQGGVYFEKELRQVLKQRFYGRPAAARQDVEDIALPLIRAATLEQLTSLRLACKSFDLFVAQLEAARSMILGPRDCFGLGDSAAESAA